WNDEHCGGRYTDRYSEKIDSQNSLQDDERLVRILVMMPNEVTLQLDDLELVVVHFGYDLRLPFFVEQAELLGEIDRFIGHVASPPVAAPLYHCQLKSTLSIPKLVAASP